MTISTSDIEELTEQAMDAGIMLAYKLMAKVFEVEAIKESIADRQFESTDAQKAIQQENLVKAQQKSLAAVMAFIVILNACSYNGTARIIVEGEEREYDHGSIIVFPDRMKFTEKTFVDITAALNNSGALFEASDYINNYKFTTGTEFTDALNDLLGTTE